MSVHKPSRKSKWWVIPLSLFVAMLLTVLPYPGWMQFAVPHWVTLVLFYWCLAVPDKVGVGTGWVTGLLLDLLLHTLFGAYAITKAFVAMAGITSHQRMRMYHLWQQCVIVFIICSIEIVFIGWVFQLTNDISLRVIYWQSALTTALIWPLVYTVLRYLRQRSGITQNR